MNVRAALMPFRGSLFEFMYPDSDAPKDLSLFWGLVAGYEAQGRPYEIEWGTGIDDNNDEEIFQGDVVRVMHETKQNAGIIHTSLNETGIVDYFDGGYFVITQEGDSIELGPTFQTEVQFFSLEIISHRLSRRKKRVRQN